MKNEEIMTNEAMEVTEETIMNDSAKTLKTLGIIGGALLVGGLAYKYAIKPIIQKHKDSKNLDKNIIDIFYNAAEEADFKEDDSEEE